MSGDNNIQIQKNEIRRNKNRQILHGKKISSNNKTIHHYSFESYSRWDITINDSIIKLFIYIFGFITGILSFYLYDTKKYIIILQKLNVFKKMVYNISPFSNKMLDNEDFKYIFIFSFVCTIIATLTLFVVLLYHIKKHKIVCSFFITLIFFIIYLYLNFFFCLLLIKIPIYVKIISSIILIISNLIVGSLLILFIALRFE